MLAANRKIKGLASAQTSTNGAGSEADSVSGLGLMFHRENPDWSPDGVVVKRVKPRGPAAASGLIQEAQILKSPNFSVYKCTRALTFQNFSQGDTVLKIDGTPTSNLGAEDLAQMCMGKRGTSTATIFQKSTT